MWWGVWSNYDSETANGCPKSKTAAFAEPVSVCALFHKHYSPGYHVRRYNSPKNLPATGANSAAFTYCWSNFVETNSTELQPKPRNSAAGGSPFLCCGEFSGGGWGWMVWRPRCGGAFTQSQTSCSVTPLIIYCTYAFRQARSDWGTSRIPCHCGCPVSNWPCGWDTYTHRNPSALDQAFIIHMNMII